jgi:hypothetical protein
MSCGAAHRLTARARSFAGGNVVRRLAAATLLLAGG